MDWIEQDTNKHQDHVIAHVLGATVLGHFAFDESMYLLLDIGFIWQIYLDGEMGLLPHTVAVNELDAAEEIRQELRTECDLLLGQGFKADGPRRLSAAPVECLIEEVKFFTGGDEWRLLLKGEGADLTVTSSFGTRSILLEAGE